MKKRFISGAIFLGLLILIMLVDIPFIDSLLVVMLSIIGIYEYNKAFKNIGYNPISWVGYIGCLAIFIAGGLINDANKIMLLK